MTLSASLSVSLMPSLGCLLTDSIDGVLHTLDLIPVPPVKLAVVTVQLHSQQIRFHCRGKHGRTAGCWHRRRSFRN